MPTLILPDGERCEVAGEELVIGRRPECDIVLNSALVSGRHARLYSQGDLYYVEDLGSKNGTTVDGITIHQPLALQHNADIQLSESVSLRFVISESLEVELVERMSNDETSIIDQLSYDLPMGSLSTQTEKKLRALLDLSRSLAGELDQSIFIPEILDTLFNIFPNTDRGCILLKDEETSEMQIHEIRERPGIAPSRFKLSRTIVDTVVRDRTGVLSENVIEDERFDASESVMGMAQRSVMCVPLLGQKHEPLGVISIDTTDAANPFQRDDLDLLMLLASQVGLACESARLLRRALDDERRLMEFSRYFSPRVVDALKDVGPAESLDPRITQVTVLFCDIRGFSRRAERLNHDLHAVMERCSLALERMTHHIIEFGGSISDFQGDAALGFWGWPITPEDGPLGACRAAVAIHNAFSRAKESEDDPLFDFNVGIGIAYGEAIAGKIGTRLQSKIGVFGHVVNLGSRLESLTKALRTPILIDEATAAYVAEHADQLDGRLRRLPVVQPYGMETTLSPAQLLPAEEDYPAVTSEDIAKYEQAVDLFTEGTWSKAIDLLDQLPVEDRAKDFLLAAAAMENYRAPANWDGVLVMTQK